MRRGIDPNSNGMEPEITAGMQRLEKGVHDAQQAMGSAPQPGNDSQQGLETALNRVERLRNQMGGLSRDGQGRQQGQQGNGQGGTQQGSGQQGGQQGGQQSGQAGGGNQGGGPVGGPGARIGGGYYGNGNRYGNPGGGVVGGVYGNYDTGNNTPIGDSPVQPDNSR